MVTQSTSATLIVEQGRAIACIDFACAKGDAKSMQNRCKAHAKPQQMPSPKLLPIDGPLMLMALTETALIDTGRVEIWFNSTPIASRATNRR